MLFDQMIYDVLATRTGTGPAAAHGSTAAAQGSTEEKTKPGQANKEMEPVVSAAPTAMDIDSKADKEADKKHAGEKIEPLAEAGPQHTRQDMVSAIIDAYLSGNHQQAKRLVDTLAGGLAAPDESSRSEALKKFEKLVSPANWRPDAQFHSMISASLFEGAKKSADRVVLKKVAQLLVESAKSLLLLGRYSKAAWIFSGIEKMDMAGPDTEEHALGENELQIHGIPVSRDLVASIAQGLKSPDPETSQSVFSLLSTMGDGILDQICEIISNEDNYSVRRLAAEILKQHGEKGAQALVSSFFSSPGPNQRARILGVIDIVTREIETILPAGIQDNNEIVRNAAFALAQRLPGDNTVHLLSEYARSSDPEIAAPAISALAKAQPSKAADIICDIMERTKNDDIRASACRALGLLADPSTIPSLAKLLTGTRGFFRKRPYPASVRIAAACALARINDPRVKTLLAPLKDDPDPGIREAVRGVLQKK